MAARAFARRRVLAAGRLRGRDARRHGTAGALPVPSRRRGRSVELQPAAGAAPSTALALRHRRYSVVRRSHGQLDEGYAVQLTCDPDAPASCRTTVSGLHPGNGSIASWSPTARRPVSFRARIALLLDASAGSPHRRVATLSQRAHRRRRSATHPTAAAACVRRSPRPRRREAGAGRSSRPTSPARSCSPPHCRRSRPAR